MNSKIIFDDYPDFRPNLTPKDMFEIGIMGGSYFRKIKSPDTNKTYKNHHLKFNFLKNIPEYKLSNQEYNKDINKYKVNVGSSYEFWIEKKWINEKYDPYGWIEWYCNFYNKRRTEDDVRQIKRWKNIAGNNGRFKKQLDNMILHNKDSPKIRQTLLHWGVDYDKI